MTSLPPQSDPSTATLYEMVRAIKEDQLPEIKQDVKELKDTIEGLQAFKTSHDALIKAAKYALGVGLAIATFVAGIVKLFHAQK